MGYKKKRLINVILNLTAVGNMGKVLPKYLSDWTTIKVRNGKTIDSILIPAPCRIASKIFA
jgi:hypothetical protein